MLLGICEVSSLKSKLLKMFWLDFTEQKHLLRSEYQMKMIEIEEKNVDGKQIIEKSKETPA